MSNVEAIKLAIATLTDINDARAVEAAASAHRKELVLIKQRLEDEETHKVVKTWFPRMLVHIERPGSLMWMEPKLRIVEGGHTARVHIYQPTKRLLWLESEYTGLTGTKCKQKQKHIRAYTLRDVRTAGIERHSEWETRMEGAVATAAV